MSTWSDEEPPALTRDLTQFIKESNRIEGIFREPLKREVQAHAQFIARPVIQVRDLIEFVSGVQPGAKIREHPGMNVRVGDHLPIEGGPHVPGMLQVLLGLANGPFDPWEVHCKYEMLHPFMDGNGRSGRVLWLWMMLRPGKDPYALRRGFLHTFYYQALAHYGREPYGYPLPTTKQGR